MMNTINTKRFGLLALAAAILLAGALTLPTMLDAGEMSLASAKVHPNPFKDPGGTTFELTMPREGTVTITVYNIRGQEVKTLVREQSYLKGVYPVYWDGKDNFGEYAPPGVYVSVLYSENTTIKSVKVVKAQG